MRKSKDKDFELIISVKEGDTSGFRFLVDKYKDVSFSLAYSILKNQQDAEDALQESFVKAFKGLKSFKFKSSFATWLYKIVVNTCKTKYESQKRYQQALEYDSESTTKHDIPDNTSMDMIYSNEQKVLVNRILDLIKEEEALLLRLYYLAELNINEIKEVTGFKESKIKVTLHRGRKNFQLKFEKMYGKEIISSS
ncbi:MAG: RNA polymerase sigma factor [Bacteroidales bacterium]|nr:RNA polymerase sigma factor [Bacteroidales bacterium]